MKELDLKILFLCIFITCCMSPPHSNSPSTILEEDLDLAVDLAQSPLPSMETPEEQIETLPPKHLKSHGKSRVWQQSLRERVAASARRWVKISCQTHSHPRSDSSVLGKLEAGAVVMMKSSEGGWAQLDNGSFVQIKALSRLPITQIHTSDE